MNKFLTVGLSALSVICGAGQVQAESVAMEEWNITFSGSDGAKVHGSIHWIDAKNPNKPTYMETVKDISQISKYMNLPVGAIVSATLLELISITYPLETQKTPLKKEGCFFTL